VLDKSEDIVSRNWAIISPMILSSPCKKLSYFVPHNFKLTLAKTGLFMHLIMLGSLLQAAELFMCLLFLSSVKKVQIIFDVYKIN
jgi:hypothetical protein